MPQPFTLGVNYWPRRKAMYWWSDFDAGEVREEFAVIRDCGLGLVRIFLLWDDFQPEPERVSSACLNHLVVVADAAAELGLQLDVTFFTGHMSGPNWAPRWLLDPDGVSHGRQVISRGAPVEAGYRNMYVDPVALDAERLQIREVVGALRGHPGVGLWNLGNEPDLFAVPPTTQAGRDWVREMTGLIKSLDPRPVTCGLHAVSLFDSRIGFRIDEVFAETDVAVMHTYPQYMGGAVAPLDPSVVPFTCALVTALCGKPALMEEFGGCTNAPGKPSETLTWPGFGGERSVYMASEEDLADYVGKVLPGLVDVGATGALLWCFADYAPELWGKPPCDLAVHERFFGLVRPDGTLKPHADVVRAFAASSPTVSAQPPRALRRVDADAYYADPHAMVFRLFSEWAQA